MAKQRVKVITVKCAECSYKYQVTVIPGQIEKSFCPKCHASNEAFKKVNLNNLKKETEPVEEPKVEEKPKRKSSKK